MRKLILIGNGFDLAHGLKTSYSDFFMWYRNYAFKKAYKNSESHYKDELVEIIRNGRIYVTDDFRTEEEMRDRIKHNQLEFNYTSLFLKDLIEENSMLKWVDIEYFYYSALLKLYKRLEKTGVEKNQSIRNELIKLNREFELIKRFLEIYLSEVTINNQIRNPDIQEYFGALLQRKEEVLILNFNYTLTPLLYFSDSADKMINIHGKIKDKTNPIIFGYGDEMDLYYSKIERLNENEFLRYIKSFGYFKTNNYRRVLSFLDKNNFKVDILGHSCGISDRILLNSIFEHEHCFEIRIYYHKRNDGTNDYFEKTQEISRHFRPENKGKMREKVVPFEECSPLMS